VAYDVTSGMAFQLRNDGTAPDTVPELPGKTARYADTTKSSSRALRESSNAKREYRYEGTCCHSSRWMVVPSDRDPSRRRLNTLRSAPNTDTTAREEEPAPARAAWDSESE